MRQLTSHKDAGLNEALQINVLDEPGQGGACHEYELRLPNVSVKVKPTIEQLEKELTEEARHPGKSKLSLNPDGSITTDYVCAIRFQNGPVKEAGFNGISQESLLAIVIDRLQSFQTGPFKCRENAIALTKCEEAMLWLQKRTRDRMARGVEGENKA